MNACRRRHGSDLPFLWSLKQQLWKDIADRAYTGWLHGAHGGRIAKEERVDRKA
jgi:hypothetical protein